MIKLYFISVMPYINKKCKILSPYSIFVLTKSFLAEGVKVQFVLDFPPLRSTPMRSCLQVTSSYS